MKKFNLRYPHLAMSIMAMTAFSISHNSHAQEEKEEIVVTGTRATIQSSIDQKRVSTEIVDGLSANEIGDIPALSIGEALQTITGASANRENGGATDVSIRGLGPFLTNTVINGREVTSGNGTRSVNFSIFPSELFNKIGIFKTQSADFIEGAVGGQIRLDTKKPIEHGKRSILLNAKGVIAEDEQNIDGGQDVGFRGTASYIDSFETENFGKFGISIGGQIRDTTNPEQEYRTSGTLRLCELDPVTGFPLSGTTTDRCDDDRPGRDGNTVDRTDPNVGDVPFAIVPSSRTYRQNVSTDERDAIFAALQWQPNDRLDLNLDIQYSNRERTELRNDLVFGDTANAIISELSDIGIDVDDGGGTFEPNLTSNDGNRNVQGLTVADLTDNFLPFVADAEGNVQQLTTLSDVFLVGTDFSQEEEYQGIGFEVKYQVNDNLSVSADLSYSNTERVEDEFTIRFGSDVRVLTSHDFSTGSLLPVTTLLNPTGVFTNGNGLDLQVNSFNPQDPNSFIFGSLGQDQDFLESDAIGGGIETSQLRFRGDRVITTNTISALRGDFDLATPDLGFISSIEGGVRFSQLEYDTTGDIRTEQVDFGFAGNDEEDLFLEVGQNCLGDIPESDFFSGQLDGAPLLVGANGEAFDSFVGIDFDCASNILGVSDFEPDESRSNDSNSIEENTFAAYLKANYETELFGRPAKGNFGVRIVNTTVDSTAFRGLLIAEIDEQDDVPDLRLLVDPLLEESAAQEAFTESNSFTEVLPSATLVVDVSDSVLLRAGVFRGLSRISPAQLGLGRDFSTSEVDIDIAAAGDTPTPEAVNAAVQSVLADTQASGNPNLDPLTSWNADLALEWYPNKDTILAAGVYYKRFIGGFDFINTPEEFTVETRGDDIESVRSVESVLVPTIQTSNQSSNLYGIELTASHSFDYLPGFLGGFGGKLSYNYASSDFEFEDDIGGAGLGVDANGNEVELFGVLPPTELFGLSRNVASAQLFWSGGAFDTQVIVKHRSAFFQQFNNDPGFIRTVDDNTVVEFRASYKLNDTIRFSFEALNVFDEERVDFRGTDGTLSQVLSFGPRYFFGIRAKL